MSTEATAVLNGGDIASIRQRMIEHPVFAAIRDIETLRVFIAIAVVALLTALGSGDGFARGGGHGGGFGGMRGGTLGSRGCDGCRYGSPARHRLPGRRYGHSAADSASVHYPRASDQRASDR
jgi:hypothetical protein